MANGSAAAARGGCGDGDDDFIPLSGIQLAMRDDSSSSDDIDDSDNDDIDDIDQFPGAYHINGRNHGDDGIETGNHRGYASIVVSNYPATTNGDIGSDADIGTSSPSALTTTSNVPPGEQQEQQQQQQHSTSKGLVEKKALKDEASQVFIAENVKVLDDSNRNDDNNNTSTPRCWFGLLSKTSTRINIIMLMITIISATIVLLSSSEKKDDALLQCDEASMKDAIISAKVSNKRLLSNPTSLQSLAINWLANEDTFWSCQQHKSKVLLLERYVPVFTALS